MNVDKDIKDYIVEIYNIYKTSKYIIFDLRDETCKTRLKVKHSFNDFRINDVVRLKDFTFYNE